MLSSIWEDVKRAFSYGNMVTRLVIVNVAVFVLMNIVNIIFRIPGVTSMSFQEFYQLFSISNSWRYNVLHPWVIFTSIFLHIDFWHLLWNMVALYWFGRIIGDLLGNNRVLPIYILGGIFGCLVYFVVYNLPPFNGGLVFAFGASASVMAILMAAGMIAPDYLVRVLLIGDVRLKYIVAAMLFLDMIGIANDVNTGGHFAHLGGFLFGWFFISQLRNGRDLGAPINQFITYIENLFARKPQPVRRPETVYSNPKPKRNTRPAKMQDSGEEISHQERLDAILDKIKQSGYESLTAQEKEFLFNASKN